MIDTEKNLCKKGIGENGKDSNVDIDLSLHYGKYLSEHGIISQNNIVMSRNLSKNQNKEYHGSIQQTESTGTPSIL